MRNRRRACVLAAPMLWCVIGGAGAAGTSGQTGWQGRWEGEARIPGAPLPLVLDLAPDATGAWRGSIILPGLGVKGAPLAGVNVGADGTLQADMAAAFSGPPPATPPLLALRMLPDGRLQGELRQGGHAADVSLQRSGDAQVDAPPASTPLPPALAGIWRGRYELGGYPRDVTLTLAPPLAQALPGAPVGQLLIVGKRRTELAIDRVVAGSRFITLEASSAGLRLEGQWDASAGRFTGQVIQGPYEAPVMLQRETAAGERKPS